MAPVNPTAPKADYQATLARAQAMRKADLVPAPETLTAKETLSASQSAPVKAVVLAVPANPSAGLAMAIADMKRYFETVTGKPVKTVIVRDGQALTLPPGSAGATIVAVGQGAKASAILPAPSGKQEGYAIKASTLTVNGQRYDVVGVNGDDLRGAQYGAYRLLELSGKRYYSYENQFTPAAGQAVLPTNGFSEVQAPTAQMQTRGFSPHMYHPIPLSEAFHNPSAEHLAMMKRYIDWQVQNGQNFIMFPMLELDQKNGLLPIVGGTKKFDAWLPFAKEIVEYAHQRGVKVSVKLAFANYVSSNVFAINPLQATYQSIRINGAAKKLETATKTLRDAQARLLVADAKLAKAAPAARDAVRKDRDAAARAVTIAQTKARTAQAEHTKLLDQYGAEDTQKIKTLIDKFMAAPWDDITWNLGTSEFTPTNDDLTIRWMNAAVDHIKKHYPKTTTTTRSHIPSKPYSEKYQASYFDLIKYADPAMGQLIHTVEAYGLADKAPVYGNQDFTHKLKQLTEATPERKDVYYPETSYWVAHDVSVPLFLPVYMLNRKSDLEIVKSLPNLDGQVGFTTGWEWGYWLNDYALARMQSHPDESLTQILDGAFAPMGAARTPMVKVMNDAMLAQNSYLLEKNLIKYVQGFDNLTDFGVKLQENPITGSFIHGTNSTPIRLRADTMMKWDATELTAFERGDLAELGRMTREFEALADRADAIRATVAPGAEKLQDELADGLRVNAVRARQVLACMTAVVDARRYQLTRSPIYKQQAEAQLAAAERETTIAKGLIADREKDYYGKPEENYGKGDSLTLWGDHYLTPVHDAKYWTNTLEEAKKSVQKAVS